VIVIIYTHVVSFGYNWNDVILMTFINIIFKCTHTHYYIPHTGLVSNIISISSSQGPKYDSSVYGARRILLPKLHYTITTVNSEMNLNGIQSYN